ncbi:MAG: hypothetical protein HY764_03545 [Candidatus Portnoybacteria bacterium]|nr:hypothetical protein [Candidatus Portnoybacteria bacterium]
MNKIMPPYGWSALGGKKILISLSIIGAAAAIVIGGTTSFFSDTETSSGNTFTAGALDLGIDNHSYYNGELNPETTWRVDYDLSDEPFRQFFNFTDLKPGDWGEDTIRLHVNYNDAWVCADVTLTSNDDNGINEPEGEDGDVTDGAGNGELADHITFYWWADDGDNVFENDETLLPAGPIGALNVNETAIVALADSIKNIWNPNQTGGPFPGDEVKFLAKAWCFGDATINPYTQDGGNQQSGPDDRPLVCSGVNEDNITQTDSLTMDIAFRAVQARNNPNFLCGQENCEPTGSSLLLNDDFEGPPSVVHSTGWDIFDNGTGGLGWSVEWVNATTPFGGFARPAVAKIEFHKSGNLPNTSDIPSGWTAHSGQQYIELDSDWNGHVGTLNNEPALARIYQDIATVPGTKYELRYWHSYRPGVVDNTMDVTADGNSLRTVAANGTGQTATNWIEYVDQFTATDASTRIEFEGAGTDDSLGIFLDDISLFELSCVLQPI